MPVRKAERSLGAFSVATTVSGGLRDYGRSESCYTRHMATPTDGYTALTVSYTVNGIPPGVFPYTVKADITGGQPGQFADATEAAALAAFSSLQAAYPSSTLTLSRTWEGGLVENVTPA